MFLDVCFLSFFAACSTNEARMWSESLMPFLTSKLWGCVPTLQSAARFKSGSGLDVGLVAGDTSQAPAALISAKSSNQERGGPNPGVGFPDSQDVGPTFTCEKQPNSPLHTLGFPVPALGLLGSGTFV